jgi:hypothetical protein
MSIDLLRNCIFLCQLKLHTIKVRLSMSTDARWCNNLYDLLGKKSNQKLIWCNQFKMTFPVPIQKDGTILLRQCTQKRVYLACRVKKHTSFSDIFVKKKVAFPVSFRGNGALKLIFFLALHYRMNRLIKEVLPYY